MKITVIGRGNVGGGLARLWRGAGHDVDELGKDGGDASGSDAVLVAVPSDAIADALGKVSGLDGKVTIDATNALGGRSDEFDSLAEQLIRDAGYEPVGVGGLDKARTLEDALGFVFAVRQAADSPIFYRFWKPG